MKQSFGDIELVAGTNQLNVQMIPIVPSEPGIPKIIAPAIVTAGETFDLTLDIYLPRPPLRNGIDTCYMIAIIGEPIDIIWGSPVSFGWAYVYPSPFYRASAHNAELTESKVYSIALTAPTVTWFGEPYKLGKYSFTVLVYMTDIWGTAEASTIGNQRTYEFKNCGEITLI